uniref:DNA-directed RNA polymerase n=1 Tax=viral metagenome TaxID=1070528 RepID=A0A6C0BPP1_9ZZZZ
MFPVRCFSCSKVIGSYYPTWLKKRRSGWSAKKTLDYLGMKRICCRRMFLSHIDLNQLHMEYSIVNQSNAIEQ